MKNVEMHFDSMADQYDRNSKFGFWGWIKKREIAHVKNILPNKLEFLKFGEYFSFPLKIRILLSLSLFFLNLH